MFGFLNRLFKAVTHIAPAKMGNLFNNALAPSILSVASAAQTTYNAVGKAIEEGESLCKW